MSACSAQAISHVGCRLIVASSANTSRPRAPAACGDIALALATKAAMSSEPAGFASGTEPAFPDAFCAEETSVADFGLVGSPDISARRLQQALCGQRMRSGQSTQTASLDSVLKRRGWGGRFDRHVGRYRPCIRHQRRLGDHWLELAVIIEEFIEHAPDRRFAIVGAAVAHVSMMIPCLDNLNPGV